MSYLKEASEIDQTEIVNQLLQQDTILGFSILSKPPENDEYMPMIKKISDDCYEVAWPIDSEELEAIQREN